MTYFFHAPKKALTIASMLALSFICTASNLRAQEIIRSPETNTTLAQRWAWAEQHARKEYPRQGAWIGYSVQQMMSSHSFIGSMQIDDDCVYHKGKSLSMLINGVPAPDSLPCGKKWRKTDGREVLKEIGFFFRYMPGRDDFAEIEMSTFSLSVDFENRAVLWLGRVSEVESIDWLKQLYRKKANTQTKEELIAVIGTHAPSAERQTFLTEILQSREEDDVRKQAAFFLGQNAERATIALLRETAERDRSEEVRKQAVFALTQTKSTEAFAALATLVKSANSREVRKDALFWLGQTHSEQAVSTLKEVLQGNDFEVQKHAVFVVTQLAEAQSLSLLIELAEQHQRAEIRKEALFWLVQTHNKKAVPALQQAVQQDEYQVQKHAVFALSQLPREEGTPLLIDIARTHANPKIRKDAMFWLGQSDDPRAAEALINIVRGK